MKRILISLAVILPFMANSAGAAVIGGRPAGCPYQFCACGVRLHYGFGDKSLNLAANWLRFPRSTPASEKVAVRRHHVFLLISHVSGSIWKVKDWNSGHHLTRIHNRSIRGFTIVDPRQRFAGAQ